ncbi:AAA family ATPase [uncultured Fusobacterium sp.]|uniref:AAA family ATPase n=1 Tax=uncultured Fusobacterium sp. TaxID=159267 RepID=UPI0025E73C07|nr:AAA family ATPase [uncultured Fusobacterium sp.]
MYKIKQIRIIGMWGIKDIDLDLNSDINFLIGRNGSGKTTILNILTSTLNLNLIDIDNLDFKKIEVILIKGKKRKKISLEKNYKQEREIIYRISNTTYNLSERVIREYLRWRGTSHIVYNNRANLDKLQTELKEIIDINLLDTNRLTKNNRDIFEREGYEEYRYERMRNILNPINIKLNFLIKELKTYKLTLKAKLETLTADFQRKVLELLIYNEDSDNIEDDKIDYNMINQIENDLEDFYKEFNYNRKDINKQIANHTSILKNEIKKKSLKEDYKTNLALLTRTKKVLEIVKELKKEKDKILFPINLYLEKLNLFMNEKKYSISEDGELKINLSKNDKEIRLEELSSGEKQIIILLTETLLQKNKTNIFIADEPEISLHIAWQRILVDTILELNSEAQIIFATHSPDIVDKKKKYIINM